MDPIRVSSLGLRVLTGAAALWALASAACGGGIRFGSLEMGQRDVDYHPVIETFKLANGMIVALAPEPSSNLVAIDLRYGSGAEVELPGKSGLAHLVEHLSFDARADPSSPALSARLATAAIQYNASTDWEATDFQAVALIGHLQELLTVEVDRMRLGCGGVSAADFGRSRAIVAAELAQRGEDPRAPVSAA
jgi:zinc protease